MIRKIFIISAILINIPVIGQGTVIYIPQDFSTIQAGITAALEGDTVLAFPGLYREEVNFIGKNITVASRFIISGDSSDIISTIIDGDSARTAVRIENGEDSTACLKGLTVTNGSGGNGGGIYCFTADPVISNNIIKRNFAQNGAGIYLGHSQAKLRDNLIKNNISTTEGGGIRCYFSNTVITDNNIIENSAVRGGGIACINSNVFIGNNLVVENISVAIRTAASAVSLGYDSHAEILNNTIACNSGDTGAAIHCYVSSTADVRNTIFRSNAPLNLVADDGSAVDLAYCDIFGGYAGPGNIDADPLLVRPAAGDYNVCGQSPCIDYGDPAIIDPDSTRSDIGRYYPDHPACELGVINYASLQGNDTTGNGTFEFPFRTIQRAVDMSRQGDSVIALNGQFTENIEILEKNIVLGSNFVLTSDTLDIVNTVIDGDSSGDCVNYRRCDGISLLKGFTITNGWRSGIMGFNCDVTIAENLISDNCGYGIECDSSSMAIVRNVIRRSRRKGIRCEPWSRIYISSNKIYENGTESWGGGIQIIYSTAVLENNAVFMNNSSGFGSWGGQGAGIACSNADSVLIRNNVFWKNIAYDGGGIACINSDITIENSILWNDSVTQTNTEIYVEGNSTLEVSYSDIDGGWTGIGNLDSDPYFRDPVNGDFKLKAIECGYPYDSPCIDAGDPNILDSLLDCSWGLGDTRSDMGAYGGGDSLITGIFDNMPERPDRLILFLNYPNPFNASTTIEYDLPEAGHVRIIVYDPLGREIETLVDVEKPAGRHQVVWDASDYSSGVYFYRIEAGDFIETKKMILLK